MRVIITGAGGTVGRELANHFERGGHVVIPWNREQTPIDDYTAMEAFVLQNEPDALFHLAIPSQPTGRENEAWWVNYHWTSELAWICRQHHVPFLYSSTVMVYTDQASGPFTPDTMPDASAGYGFEKLLAEQRALYQNPNTVIARLGWQIGTRPGSNNMIDFFEREMQEKGEVKASRRWYPACSFVQDTAMALAQLIEMPGGIYLLDSNRQWTFYEIASALNNVHGRPWNITPSDDFVYDQRMQDPRVKLPPLNARLPQLP